MTFGTGLIVEPDHISASANANFPLAPFVASVARPARVSWVHLRDQTLNQQGTGACVGCAFSTCLYLTAKVREAQGRGKAIPRPSAKLIYDLARLADGERELFDVGCLPIDAIRKSGDKGLVAWADWPLFTADPEFLALCPKRSDGEWAPWIDTPPDFSVFYKAIDARVIGYLRADVGDVIAQLEGALAIGHIPAFGMYVPHDYGDVRGPEIYDVPAGATTNELRDRAHMQAIVGYDEDAFLIDSSWGKEHGENGIVRIAKRFVASQDWSFSRTVVTSAPERLLLKNGAGAG